MPVDTHLSAIHFRVLSAGMAIETAIEMLRARRVFQGRMAVMRASSDLRHAMDYATAAGNLPNLAAYLAKLSSWYDAEASKVLRPSAAPGVADELYANQGRLEAADPFGPAAPRG